MSKGVWSTKLRRERELLFIRNEGMEKMTVGVKGYDINTTRVTHKRSGLSDPGAQRQSAEVPRRPERIRIQLGWLFVATII